VPYLNVSDAAKRLKCARSTLRDRISRDPDRYRTDAAGRVWLDDIEPVAAAPAPVDLAALPPVPPRRPVSSAIETQRIPSAPAVHTRPRVEPVSGLVTKWIAIPDVHAPYHDSVVMGLIVRAGDAIGASCCVQLGDLTDCYSVSRFPKARDRRLDIAWELDTTCEVVDVLDKAFPDERVITLGNHDVRMERYVAEKAPEIAGLFPKYVDRIGFKERGWRVAGYMDDAKIGNLNVTHEAGYSGATAHMQTLGVYQSNVIHGHTHRLGWGVLGNVDGGKRVGAMLGWCGDVEKIDYHHRARVARESAHGFGIIYVEPDGRATVVPVLIDDGRCVVEGKVIR
jgi:predicted phosphodiesterase